MTPTARPRLVVIDDDDDLRQTLAFMLTEAGYDVVDFGHAAAALTYLEDGGGPDLILVDLMMPGINGWEFCERRLESPKLSKIPVVVLTARSSYLRPSGVSDVLQKPFEISTLLALVAKFRLQGHATLP